MERIEVLDRHGRVQAAGFFCDLHHGLSESVDIVDLGVGGEHATCCHACAAEFDGWCAGRGHDEVLPEDFWETELANDNGSDWAAE